jgi:modification methylase
LIRMYSVKGDTVLDPFLGTGTTLKEAIELERNFIGYEINEKALPKQLLDRRDGCIDIVRRD